MPDEEAKKKAMMVHQEMMMKMKAGHDKMMKDMQDPEKRAKIEEAKKKQEEEVKKRKEQLTEVAKNIQKWGLKEHTTVLGPNSIDYFRMDNFSKIVLEHAEEIRKPLLELFPKMPEIKTMQDTLELA